MNDINQGSLNSFWDTVYIAEMFLSVRLDLLPSSFD